MEASTHLSGSCKSPAPRRPIILSAATQAPSASANRPCIFRLAADRSRASASPARSSGAACLLKAERFIADMGSGTVVSLPAAETERRWRETTTQWPIVHAILHGVSQNQMMARHRANHVNVAYAPTAEIADKALATKAAMLAELGVRYIFAGSMHIASSMLQAAGYGCKLLHDCIVPPPSLPARNNSHLLVDGPNRAAQRG